MDDADVTTYRVKARCIVGGGLREAGEVFACKKLDKCPPHLEEVTVGAEAKDFSAKTNKRNKGVTAADIGVGAEAKDSSNFTSADMIK